MHRVCLIVHAILRARDLSILIIRDDLIRQGARSKNESYK